MERTASDIPEITAPNKKIVPVRKAVFLSLAVVFIVLLIDQCSKIWVKTHMELDEEIRLAGNWAYIHFTENPGMAFGLILGGEYGKLALTLFRIVAVGLISWFLFKQIRNGATKGFIIFAALILAGAMGNIIDSIFYGVLFTDSHFRIAEVFPEQGYSSWFHGYVVDMFYFPVIQGHYPSWFGSMAGNQFIFFRPIFNVADAAISTGVIAILIFQRSFFLEPKEQQLTATIAEETPSENTVDTDNQNL